MAPYVILHLVTGPVHSFLFQCHTHIQHRAAHGALHYITPGHWTSSFMSIYPDKTVKPSSGFNLSLLLLIQSPTYNSGNDTSGSNLDSVI